MTRRGAALGLLLIGSVATGSVGSAVINSLDVDRNSGRYELVADTHLAAPAEAIYAVLIDYEDGAFGRISSVYKESDYLEPAPDGTPIVYTRMEGCLMFYCKSMRRVERLEVEPPYYIRTTALPEQSDFTYSRSEWELEPVENGTRVKYRLIMEPDFWVPPVIGPWLLKRTLMKGGTRAINRIERLARTTPDDSGQAFGYAGSGPGEGDRVAAPTASAVQSEQARTAGEQALTAGEQALMAAEQAPSGGRGARGERE